MEKSNLGIMEYHLLSLIWENEPLTSMKLVQLCGEAFDWKKSTTYTMLKRLQQKGFVQNEGTVVSSLIDRDSVQSSESESFVANTFSGSLPGFLAAFFNGKTISDEEAEELKKLIDSYRG